MKVSDYVPIAMSSVSPNTRKGWTTYARRITELWGDLELDAVRKTDVEAASREVRENAVRRATSTMGTGASEGFISCARAIWNRAMDDGLATKNPASAVGKPARRAPQARRALTVEELRKVQGVLSSSRDPALALAVFRTFLETGARRRELLGVRVRDLATTAAGPTLTLEVGTKAHSMRHQPITAELAAALETLATTRVGDVATRGQEPLLRNLRGEPIGHRWLEYNARRVREQVPELGTTTEVWYTWHLLRHTAAVMVERVGGFAAAQTFLGHSTKGASATAVTLHYSRASTDELRRIHARIWNPPLRDPTVAGTA